jgi:predicted amidophosphoribosyltransferase
VLPWKVFFFKQVKVTSAQATKTKAERAQNIKGAFEVNRLEWIAEKNVLLVDDVFTIGTTIYEAAKTLKKAGAGKVYIFTLGRVVVGKGLDR